MNINDLSAELLSVIFSKLDVRDICQARRVCSLWSFTINAYTRLPCIYLGVKPTNSPDVKADTLNRNEIWLCFEKSLQFIKSTSSIGGAISLEARANESIWIPSIAEATVQNWKYLNFLEIGVRDYNKTLRALIETDLTGCVNSINFVQSPLAECVNYETARLLKCFHSLKRVYVARRLYPDHVEALLECLNLEDIETLSLLNMCGVGTSEFLTKKLVFHWSTTNNLSELQLGSMDGIDLPILFGGGMLDGIKALKLNRIYDYRPNDLLFLNKMTRLQSLSLSLPNISQRRLAKNAKVSRLVCFPASLKSLKLDGFINGYKFCNKIACQCPNLESLSLLSTFDRIPSTLSELVSLKRLSCLQLTVFDFVYEDLLLLLTHAESIRFLTLEFTDYFLLPENASKCDSLHNRFFWRARRDCGRQHILTTQKKLFSKWLLTDLPNLEIRLTE